MNTSTWRGLTIITLGVGCLLAAGPLVNGNFSAGLTGWSVDGTAAAVGAQGNIVPPGGSSFQARIPSGSPNADVPVAQEETDLNLPAGAIQAALPNNYAPTRGSVMWQTFTAHAGATFTFQWNFSTNEGLGSKWDAALYSLRRGSGQAQVFSLADT